MEIDFETGAAVLHIHSRKWGAFRVLIDPEDWAHASAHTWHMVQTRKDRRNGRHYFRSGETRQYLHRFIMGEPEDMMVDHRDPSATLDNQKRNLRIATLQQNNFNTRKRSTPTSSRYKGVCYRKDTRKWKAYVDRDGKKRNLGHCPDTPEGEIECARLYDCAARVLHGEFALLNFPDSSDCAQRAA